MTRDETEASRYVAIMREVWIDQNADKARLIASGWWPAQGAEERDDDRDEGGSD